MDARDQKLARLLRAAVTNDEVEMPYGFDTRVVADWRDEGSARGLLATFMQRVAAGAAGTAAAFSVAAYLQFRANDSLVEPLSNNYAIADSAIQSVTTR